MAKTRISVTRRHALLSSAAVLSTFSICNWRSALAAGEVETHGLSTFGELQQPADFKVSPM